MKPGGFRCVLTVLVIAASPAFPSVAAAPVTFDPNQFRLAPGLRMELWAAEPDVVDPVAMCFDARGVAYVVEMRDYPLGCGPDHTPCGTIRRLEDTDGDGRPDRVTLFAERLSFPTSITPWRGGVLVTAPPQILWLRDADGDGRAEIREVALDGFKLGVTDSNVNGLRFGLDNQVHGVNGGNGGVLRSPKRPTDSLELRGDDFSFNPDTGVVRPTWQSSGGFGLVFDEWGRSFVTYNIDHIQHRVLSKYHAGRHRGFPAVPLTQSISDHEPMARIFPASPAQTRPNHPEQSGHFSSAGGMGYVGVPGYPGDISGSVLVCDVVGNLIHRDVLSADGPIFKASRSTNELQTEFLAGRDPAFRPVGVELGPDGALYVVDMQREVIEHPDYIPDAVKTNLNLRAGEDRGRIYRISPKIGFGSVRPALDSASNAELVAMLGHPNAWWRLTSQRLLVERKAVEVVPALRKLARGLAHRIEDLKVEGMVVGKLIEIEGLGSPLSRLHSLWTLMGLGALEEGDLLAALADGEAGVRENAAILAERFLPDARILHKPASNLAFDPSARVRFQAALALGSLPTPEGLAGLQHVLRTDLNSVWSRRAVWASLGRDVRTIANAMLVDRAWIDPRAQVRIEVWRELSELVAARSTEAPEEVSWLIGRMGSTLSERVRVAVVEGIADGLGVAGTVPPMTDPAKESLRQLSLGPSRELIRATWRLTRALGLPENEVQRRTLQAALGGARDAGRRLEERLTDIRLLAFGAGSQTTNVLVSLLDSREPVEIQRATLEVLRQQRDRGLGEVLVGRWRSFGPSIRPAVLQYLLDQRSFHEPLVAALEQGRLTVGELNLDLEQRRRLLVQGGEEIRRRAERLLGDGEYSNRKQVVADWLSRMPSTGDREKGRVVFETLCTPCHVAHGVGNRVGPDLGSVAHRSVEDLISNILDPNMAINPAYVAYTAETKDGEVTTGILAAESSNLITLLQPGGRRVVLTRSQLMRLESAGASLMPEGIEKGRTVQDFRDLVAFLQW